MSSPSSILKEAAAGLTSACLALPLAVSAGVLAYSPLGPAHVGDGAAAGIVSAVVGGAVASLLRGSSFITTIPTNPNALIQASLLASLVAAFGDNPAHGLAAAILCAALAGLWQALIGLTGLARIIKLAPYPVIAGFVTGVGILIVMSQLPAVLATGPLKAFSLSELSLSTVSRLAFVSVLVAVVVAIQRLAPKAPALLLTMVAGYAAYHALGFVFPALDVGPTVGSAPIAFHIANTIGSVGAALGAANPDVWKVVLTGSLTLALVGTLDTVFTLRAAKNIADIPVNENRDLVGQGLASVVSSAGMGGLFVSTSMSLSAANYQAGGRSRVSTLSTCLVLFLGTTLLPGLIFSLPVLALAAVLLVVGFNLIDKWLIRTFRRAVARGETGRADAIGNLGVAMATTVATVLGQPVVGAAVGVVLACIVFMVEMNRPVIRAKGTAETLRSKRVRSRFHNGLLTANAHKVGVIQLQGVVFFGNAEALSAEIEERYLDVEVLVLDFHGVTNIDVSGTATLQQIAHRLKKRGVRVLISGVRDDRVLHALSAAAIDVALFATLDAALEEGEEHLLASTVQKTEAVVPLESTDLAKTIAPEHFACLKDYMSEVVFEAGAALCRAGGPSDRLWVLTRGSVSAWASGPVGEIRLASLGPGCTVGEMGIVDGAPRSADVRADDRVMAYELTSQRFQEVLQARPLVGEAVLRSIARQLAQRLRDTTSELRRSEGFG